MKIKYKYNDKIKQFETICGVNGKIIMVGSSDCQNCKYHVGMSKIKQFVICSEDDNGKTER